MVLSIQSERTEQANEGKGRDGHKYAAGKKDEMGGRSEIWGAGSVWWMNEWAKVNCIHARRQN